MDYEKTCCFTGHRPDKLPWGEEESDPRCLRLKEAVARAVEDAYVSGIRRFITGMARGVDLYCAEAVLALRVRPALRDPGGQLAGGTEAALPVHSGPVRL